VPAGGVTQRRLLNLWKAHLLNRWAFPGIPPSEFHYYLDNKQALDLLAARRDRQISDPMLEELRNNREKDASAATRGQHIVHETFKETGVYSQVNNGTTTASYGHYDLSCPAATGELADVLKASSEECVDRDRAGCEEAIQSALTALQSTTEYTTIQDAIQRLEAAIK
jgi:hypothetical protein